MRRIAINGCSGSGKTRLAQRVSEVLDLPYVEIDSLYHGPDWMPRPEFLADVAAVVAGERWVIEYQYTAARPLILERADTVVWLDLPRWLTMWQVTRRTIGRRVHRRELWNGNREGPLWRILFDDEHIIRWAWRTYRLSEQRIEQIRRDRPDLPVVQLRSRREVAAWLDALERGLSSDDGTPAPPR